jgi:hypothetical protein
MQVCVGQTDNNYLILETVKETINFVVSEIYKLEKVKRYFNLESVI